MGVLTRQNDVLKLVHPGRHVEVFREPFTAGELMRKYPRHCIARPDVFEFPWIAVHPESVLPLGKVFYLVPYQTMCKIMKAKTPQQQQQQRSLVSSKHRKSSELSPDVLNYKKSLAGVTSKHQQHDGDNMRQSYNRNVNCQESCKDVQRQGSDNGSLYKLELHKSTNTRRSNENQTEESYYYLLDSPFDSRRPRVRSAEQIELLSLKSCLRKLDIFRKKLSFCCFCCRFE